MKLHNKWLLNKVYMHVIYISSNNLFNILHSFVLKNVISDLKTQVFREGQTKPRDYEIRIQRKKLCIHALWKASATP